MAQIILNIPDGVLQRVMDAIAGMYNRPTQVDDGTETGTMIPNPETKAQFSKRILREWLKARVVTWESMQAGKSAEVSARITAESEITIT